MPDEPTPATPPATPAADERPAPPAPPATPADTAPVSDERPAPPAPPAPAAPAMPQPGPTPFAPPPSFIQPPPVNQQYTPQHVQQIQHVVPPSPVTERDSASWGPGALAGLLIFNTAMASQWALNKYWLDNSFGDDWWSLFFVGGAVLALFGLLLVRPGPIGARFFGLLAGGLGCLPFIHSAIDTNVSTRYFVTNVLTIMVIPGLLGLIALISQPRNR